MRIYKIVAQMNSYQKSLIKNFKVSKMYAGSNFKFGKNREGSIEVIEGAFALTV